MNRFILFDNDEKVVNALKEEFNGVPNFEFWLGDCRQLIEENNIDIIVSPANCLGYMDGGIDYYYTKMFKNIEKTVRFKIKTYGIPFNQWNMMLPIGSSVICETNNIKCPYMMCTPTMVVPQSIVKTDNVYQSFFSIFMCLRNRYNVTIAVPGFGTCTGRIDPKVAAKDMRRAYNDFTDGIRINQDKILIDEKDEYVLREHACEQPDRYAR